MLVLTRKENESIVIGDSIVFTVLSIEGEQVKIGITAPRDVTILRYEVFQAVQEQARIQERLAEEPKSENFERLRSILASEDEENSEQKTNDSEQP